MVLKLNDELDTAAAAKEYKKAGRVRLAGVLDDASADALYQAMFTHCIWRWTYRVGKELKSVSGEDFKNQTQRRQREHYERMYDQARQQSQHVYFACALTFNPTDEEPGPLADADTLFKSDAFRDLVRKVTGRKEGDVVNAQARWFNRDQFQTDNIDLIDESDSAAMFDLSLAKDWRTDWGGLLSFLDGDGNIEETMAAGFNTLDLFALPCRRSVSYVPPFQSSFNLGVTGEMS